MTRSLGEKLLEELGTFNLKTRQTREDTLGVLNSYKSVWKGKKVGHWKMNSPGREVPNMLLEISGELTPEEWMDGAKAKTIPSWGWD